MKSLLVAIISFSWITGNTLGQDLDTKSNIVSEIERHVIEECDLFMLYKKNRIDFDPIEVGSKIAEIYKKDWKWRRAKELTQQIYSVVRHEHSFYKRSRIYDVYYGVCVQKINAANAEKLISRIFNQEITNSAILSEDKNVHERFALPMYQSNDKDRALRDRSKVRLLRLINDSTDEKYIIKKNLSVIQEYLYNIEMWEW